MRQTEILYLHVSPKTKRWFKSLCAKQTGRVSQSTMAEQVFEAVRDLGLFTTSRKTKGKDHGEVKV